MFNLVSLCLIFDIKQTALYAVHKGVRRISAQEVYSSRSENDLMALLID